MSMGSCRMARAYISLDAIMEDQISSCTMIDMNTHISIWWAGFSLENSWWKIKYCTSCMVACAMQETIA